MSQPREPRDEDPTTEYVRSALHEAAQSYRPGRTAMAERVAAEAGLSWRAGPRAVLDNPQITALSSERGLIMPSFESAISRYFRECEVNWRAQAFLDAAE